MNPGKHQSRRPRSRLEGPRRCTSVADLELFKGAGGGGWLLTNTLFTNLF